MESRTPVVHLLDARGAGAISEASSFREAEETETAQQARISEAFLLPVEKIILSRPG